MTNGMRRRARPLAAWTALVVLAPPAAAASKWVEARSPSFTVWSDAGPGRAPISPPNGDILSAVRRRTARAPTTEEPIVAQELKIWMNGHLVSQAEAVLPVNSAAVFYATNVFEGLRAYWNAEDGELYCFRLAEHFARLRESMKMMRFTVPYRDMDLYEAVRDVLRGNEIRDVSVIPKLFKDFEAQGESEIWNIQISDQVVAPVMRATVKRGHGVM